MARKGIMTYDEIFEGLIQGQIYTEKASRIFPIDELLIHVVTPRYLRVAEALERVIVMGGFPNYGVKLYDYILDFLMNRIWVDPLRIAAGFITEEQLHEIEIWNAYLERSVDWTAVSVINEAGTDFDYPALTFEIPKTADLVQTMTIYKYGPPLQDTYYKLTIDGLEFDIYIDGIRVIPLEPEMNWIDNLKSTYSFETVMYNTEYFYEQRRALMEQCRRGAGFKLTLDRIDNHRFFNAISYAHDKILGVPIFSEQMFPTALTIGSTAIPISNSNEFLWNMQNRTTFVMAVDHENNKTEIKEILNFTDFNINLKSQITETFNVNTSIVYPCLFCTVRAARFKEVTSHINEAQIEMQEFQSG
jgi:ribosomal protein L23